MLTKSWSSRVNPARVAELPYSSEILLHAAGINQMDRRTGQQILHDIQFELRTGGRVSIQGPTGAGKTVFLRCLAMLDTPSSGMILWHGANVRASSIPRFRSRVIYLHQKPWVSRGTVKDNMLVPLRLRHHRHRTFSDEKVGQWLEILHRPPSFLLKQGQDLSGGEAQILALMRALQLDPDVLLLDEPTTALDESSRAAAEQLVNSWWQEDPATRAFVWVSHDRAQLVRMTTRTHHLNHGVLEYRG